LFALYRGIAEVSRDPAIGLKLGSEQRLERDSPAPIAALYTRSFREAIQRELARYYLLHASLELNETAYLLGYENANSFFRAFHHWDGTSPGQWRHIQRRANGESPYCCSKAIMSGA
jgi:AraC-like DNA-binding protein